MTLGKKPARAVLQAAGLALIWMVLVASYASAQDETELAKEAQNPVSDLISLPLQNNFNFGAGSKDKMIYLLNIQPVIPFHLSENWTLITRTIMPIINQPSLVSRREQRLGTRRY